MKAEKGDIIFAIKYKGTYLHYGVYIGNERVIHYRTEDYNDNIWCHAKIIETSLKEFAHGSPIYREPEHKGANWFDFSTVRAGKKMLGTGLGEYDLIHNNCEHFANYCMYGKKVSRQINRIINKFKLFSPPLLTIIENYVHNNYIIPKNCEQIDIV